MTLDEIMAIQKPTQFEDEICDFIWNWGFENGIEGLNKTQLVLFWVESFFMELDMGGLSAYFYNLLPERFCEILNSVGALREAGANRTATLLSEAAEIFRDYQDPLEGTTWNEILKVYDPSCRLETIAEELDEIRREDISTFVCAKKPELVLPPKV